MMRTKVLAGLLTMAIVGIAVGHYLCNKTGAQDAPTSGKQLFDLLKKDLDAKKDVVLPALPKIATGPEPTIAVPPPMVVDGPKPNAPAPKPVAVPTATDEPTPIPAAPTKPNPPVPQAYVPQVETKLPPNERSQSTTGVGAAPMTGTITLSADPVPPVVKPETPRVTPPAPPSAPPRVSGPANVANPAFPPPPVEPPLTPPVTRSQPPVQTLQMIVPTPKNSPWSFQVDVSDLQSTVTATVNKKHAFKIVCKHVDLQTEQGTLKARGSVKITGESFEGSCTNLSIPLNDDRLLFEGSADVRIHRSLVSGYVANPSVTQFELKGEALNLRVSELQSGKFLQTSMRQVPEPALHPIPAPTATPSFVPTGKNWSPAGRLRQTNEKYGEQPIWCLEDSAGRTICRFITREGGSLTQYAGQTISVYLESHDRLMDRVTHIAIP